MKKALLILGILSLTIPAVSQSTCTQILREARTIYDEGRIHELPGLLENCIQNGFADDEKTEAYRLLILSYIYLDEPKKADAAMLALLHHNHEFKLNEQVDPAEFISLYHSFRTNPIFLYGLEIDINTTFVNVIKAYGVHNLNATMAKYQPEFSIGGTFVIEKEIRPRITGRAEFHWTTNKFTYTNSFLDAGDQMIASPEATETQSWMGLSVLGQYKVLNSSLNPYVTLGPSLYYLLASPLSAETAISGGEQATGINVDLIPMRKHFHAGVTVGAGIKKKIGGLFFTAGIKYNHGLLNITKKHFDNELSLKYGMALNDISINTLTLSVGMLFQKFNPKKL